MNGITRRNIDMNYQTLYSDPMAKLWKRKSTGVYYAVWMEDGKQRKKSLKTSNRKIANRKLNNFIRELRAGKIKPISHGIRQTLYPFVDEFLEHIAATKSLTTYELYETALKKAKDSWGDIPLQHVTSRHIDKVMADMIKTGLAIPTVNKNYRHIKAALNKARSWKYIKNPIDFPKPIAEEEKVRYLSAIQLKSLISEIDDPEFVDFCMLSAYTGLRSSEIIRLTWDDADNPKGFLRISPKQKNKKESWIPINANARAILDRCKKRKEGHKIFRFQSRQWVSKKFKKAARGSGLPDFRFHDLRHTCGSHLAMSGENEATIQKLMRHKSMASTMIYTNVSPEYLKQASEKVNYGPMPLPKKKK